MGRQVGQVGGTHVALQRLPAQLRPRRPPRDDRLPGDGAAQGEVRLKAHADLHAELTQSPTVLAESGVRSPAGWMDFAGRRRAVAPCASVLLLRRGLREVYRSLCTNRHASPRQSGLLCSLFWGLE